MSFIKRGVFKDAHSLTMSATLGIQLTFVIAIFKSYALAFRFEGVAEFKHTHFVKLTLEEVVHFHVELN